MKYVNKKSFHFHSAGNKLWIILFSGILGNLYLKQAKTMYIFADVSSVIPICV